MYANGSFNDGRPDLAKWKLAIVRFINSFLWDSKYSFHWYRPHVSSMWGREFPYMGYRSFRLGRIDIGYGKTN